jgi:hypothetical protein
MAVCHPILFEFTELCDTAMLRILSLAKDARMPGRLGPKGFLSPTTKRDPPSTVDYIKATVYFILAPIACFKILQRQLTLVDLQLDPHIKLQYLVAKILYYSFFEDHLIARSPKEIKYDPKNGAREGIRPAAFDIILDGLIEDKTVISFSKFSERFGQSWHTPDEKTFKK